jgi:hypothetical protein
VPERVDLRTGAIACRTDKVHHFRCGPMAALFRAGRLRREPRARWRAGCVSPRCRPTLLHTPERPLGAGGLRARAPAERSASRAALWRVVADV